MEKSNKYEYGLDTENNINGAKQFPYQRIQTDEAETRNICKHDGNSELPHDYEDIVNAGI